MTGTERTARRERSTGKVERAAAKVAASRRGLEAAVRESHAAGESLRSIAAAAGVSHEQVRRMLG